MKTESQTLWVPGMPLEGIAQETPSQEALLSVFHEFVAPSQDAQPVKGALGALARPKRPIRGFAFLDLDDVVHDLSGSLQGLQFSTIRRPHERRNNHDYGEDMWFHDDDMPLKKSLYALIRSAGSAGLQLVEGFEEIQWTIRCWRAAGVITGFVSSLTPGSELPTATNFLGRHFKNNCDFLVIPDGHYLVSDKGKAVTAVLDTLVEQLDAPVPAVAIDDIGKHASAMRVALKASAAISAVQAVQPTFPSNPDIWPLDPESLHVGSSAAAFAAGTEFFRMHLTT